MQADPGMDTARCGKRRNGRPHSYELRRYSARQGSRRSRSKHINLLYLTSYPGLLNSVSDARVALRCALGRSASEGEKP
jgi:hypothetical protein